MVCVPVYELVCEKLTCPCVCVCVYKQIENCTKDNVAEVGTQTSASLWERSRLHTAVLKAKGFSILVL